MSTGSDLFCEAQKIAAYKDSPLVLWPLPDQRHLYMLVAGVVLGVLLGPAVLGRLAPEVYDPLFVGSGDTTALEEAEAKVEAFKKDDERRDEIIEEVIAQYDLIGSDEDSIAIAKQEQLVAINNRFAEEEAVLRDAVVAAQGQIVINRQAHLQKLSSMSTVMILLVVLLLAAEAILSPQRKELEEGEADVPTIVPRLMTIRYGLLAGWLMLMLAQPHWLRGIDPVFAGLLAVVVLGAGLVPLGKRASQQS